MKTTMDNAMNYTFEWNPEIEDKTKKIIEEKIREILDSGHYPIKTCHENTGIVTMSLTNPLCLGFAGNIKCSCCKVPQATIIGNIDGPVEINVLDH